MFDTIEAMELMDWYYLSNKIWVYANVAFIPLFFIPCVIRFFNLQINKYLITDQLTRICLIFSAGFYVFDMAIKFQVDGADSICEKAFYTHHIASLLIVPPLFLNWYIPWFVGPIGFMHGFCLLYPEVDMFSYIYICFLFFFHYKIYQEPYKSLKGYQLTRLLVCYIYMFALLLLIGDCSNYLPFGPPQ